MSQMPKSTGTVLKTWLVVSVLVGTMAYAVAENITLTTYYPSPRGMYKELRTRDNTYLATTGGNVGIGTTIPVKKTDITYTSAASTEVGVRIRNNNTSHPTMSGIELFTFDGANIIGSKLYTTSDSPYGWTDQRFTIATQAVGSETYTDTLTAKDGSVGIGVTAPAERLHVSGGNLRVDGNATINGNQVITGTVRIQGGSPQNGRVLKTDGAGNATWQDATAVYAP